MKIVYSAHALSSCWNNGNAHFLRGLLCELGNRGHDIVACEPAVGWSKQNLIASHGAAHLERFRCALPGLKITEFYDGQEPSALVEGADLVVVNEWTAAHFVSALGALRKRGAPFLLLYHDTLPGLIVEWDLDEAQSDQLLRLVAWARVDRRALAGYAAAYAAFRAALATMGREEDEAGNRRAAIAFYSNRLARELDLVAAQSREGSAWRSPSS